MDLARFATSDPSCCDHIFYASNPGVKATNVPVANENGRFQAKIAWPAMRFTIILIPSGLSGSGADAAMRPVSRHVRRLVEQPKPLPLITRLTKVF